MKKRTMVNGWLFIPGSLVFASFVWGVVQEIPGIMLKSLDVSNTLIGLTSLLGLPLALRFLFAPFVDHRGTKRRWTLVSQRWITGVMLVTAGVSGLLFFLSSMGIALPGWQPTQVTTLMVLFAVLSLMSVFHDIAWGGYFLVAVDERDKALFAGINATFIRLAIMFSQGFMVILAGKVGEQAGDVMAGWAFCFIVLGAIQLGLMLYHHFIYPYPSLDKPIAKEEQQPFLKVFAHFFKLPRAGVILAFVFLYRLGEGVLARMKIPFLMDAPEQGGLGLTLEHIGVMNGLFTVLGMVLGGLIGGLLVKKYGLRKTLLPSALLLTVPNLGFVWLAANPIYTMGSIFGMEVNLWALGVLMIEAVGYGIGFAAYGFLQVEASRGKYRATFYALLAGVMTLCWVLTGSLSGFIQAHVGYVTLFALSVVLAVPGILIIHWLPLKELAELGKQEDAERHAANNAQ